MKLFQGFALAFNMLTIIPFFKVHDFFKGINGYSAMFYPLVGFLLGSFLWLTHTLLEGSLPSIHLAVIIFALWITLTGALHLDGLSDSIDGLFVPKERALEVMKDSHVGGMGMVFTSLFLLLKLSSLIFFEAYYLLPIILMLSRLNASLAIYFFEYSSLGVGSLLKEEFQTRHLVIAVSYSVILTLLFSFNLALPLAFMTFFIVATLFSQRLNGLSGDVYGFIIEVSELLLLNLFIIQNFS